MTWFIKNWYFVLIGVAFILWVLLDPSYEQKDSMTLEVSQLSNETESEEETEETSTPSVEYMVDIKGAVKQPGVYQVTEANRVKDVIQMAGGLQAKANKEAINLAERVYDEMVILVPFMGEEHTLPLANKQDGKIKINHATVEEIMNIPGIGEVKANAIIDYREKNGNFKQLEDLTQVSGIGDKTLEQMEEHVQIP